MHPLLAQSYYYSSGSPIFSFVLYGIGFVVLAAGIYGAIDANKYDDWVWQQSGQNSHQERRQFPAGLLGIAS